MRLQELFETTEEDRALISLSSAIYGKVKEYINTDIDYDDEDEELIALGRIGELFDTPIGGLDKIGIEIQGGEPFIRRLGSVASTDIVKLGNSNALAFWEEDTKTIVLNQDFLDSDRMRTTVTHELRHALDTVKSNSYPGDAKRYFTPKKKEHRKTYPDETDPRNQIPYRAQPAEINARFSEVLDVLATAIIPRSLKLDTVDIRAKVMNDLRHLLVKYHVAELFPERTQSKDYKRLIKRAVDFVDKELTYRGIK